MAVKPLTQPLYWATDAVYSTGPFIGQPQKVTPPLGFAAEGHRPGALFPTPAEYENSQQYNLTGLARWVFAGSSAGAADAHPLETDSNGETQVERARVVPTNPNSYALYVQAPPSAGFAVQATGGSMLGDATIIGETTGSGAAFEAMAATAGASFLSARSGSGHGVSITHTGSGNAARLDASGGTGVALLTFGGTTTTAAVITGGAGQAAMLVTGGNNGAVAAQFLGTGTGLGIVASGGATSANATGVRGDALHADAMGVHGRTSTSASTTAAGVRGEARGAGTAGVHADGGTVGRGLVAQADASSPGYSAVRIIPQDDDPTSATNDGELIWHASHKTLRTCIAGYGYRSMPTFGPGSALSVNAAQAIGDVDAVGSSYGVMPLLSVLCDSGNGTAFYGSADGAQVLIKFSCNARSVVGSAAAEHLNVKIVDVTNGNATIEEWEGVTTPPAPDDSFTFTADDDDWRLTVSVAVRYPPPADGDLEIAVFVSRPAATNNLEVRNAMLEVIGTF